MQNKEFEGTMHCIDLDGDYGSSAPASFKLKTGDAGGAGGAYQIYQRIVWQLGIA